MFIRMAIMCVNGFGFERYKTIFWLDRARRWWTQSPLYPVCSECRPIARGSRESGVSSQRCSDIALLKVLLPVSKASGERTRGCPEIWSLGKPLSNLFWGRRGFQSEVFVFWIATNPAVARGCKDCSTSTPKQTLGQKQI